MPVRADWEAIQKRIDGSEHGNKTGAKNDIAKTLGISVSMLEKMLMKETGKKKAVPTKAEKEASPLVHEVAKIKVEGMGMHLKKRELSTAATIEMLADRGIPGAESLKVSTVNKKLREAGFRDRPPKCRVEASYANQEHQLDFSRSKYFQVKGYDAQKNDWILISYGKELHYKKDDRRLRTWLCQIKESYSRLRTIRAYAAASEDGFIGLETIHYMLHRPEDDPHLMRHIPDIIKVDQGAFYKRKEVRAAMEALGIELRASAPGAHDSQGKVEAGFRSIWGQFELKMAIRVGFKKKILLSEYNEMLHEFTVKEHQAENPLFKGQTYGAVYQKSIMTHPQNHTDVDMMEIACRVETRKVRQDLLVSFGGVYYGAPAYCVDKTIRVYKNLNGGLMGELVEQDHKVFDLAPPKEGERYPHTTLDHFKSYPETYQQRIEKELEKGDRRMETGYREGNRIFMPAKSTQREVNSVFVNSEINSEPAIFTSLHAAHVYINAQIKAITGDGVYADYAPLFNPLLAESLEKGPIEEKLALMRESVRELRMEVR